MSYVAHQYSRVDFYSSLEVNLSLYYGGVGSEWEVTRQLGQLCVHCIGKVDNNCTMQLAISRYPTASWTNIHNIMPKLCLNPNYKPGFRRTFTTSKHWFNSRSLSARGFLSSSEILRALFCTLVEWHGVINLYILKKITSWRRLKRAHYASKLFDLLEITITCVVRQLRKFW